MIRIPYDSTHTAARPTLEIIVRRPGSATTGAIVRLVVDSGAEQTVIPPVVAQQQQLHSASAIRSMDSVRRRSS